MEKVIIDENSKIKNEELHIVLRKTSKLTEKEDIRKGHDLYEFFRDLNPRYLEEGISTKDAMNRIYSSARKFRTIFDFSRMF